ncbi:response regulator [Parvibaculum sedimenti]|uniref:Response regulator n=1 Tax=Parvibaculum sedimenti TaxID=2608632 RepID=A0A6N6VKN2_9HYPH|nr:response regulator [Parvibaculum sedimenti]KAB7739495.1 response regulator [Parvibaculum sedimenti]
MARSLFEMLTILVVDDSLHMRRLIARLLDVLGVGQVIVASDGEEAWAKFLEHRPDVVITDAAMKPTDGFVLAQRLRAIGEDELRAVPIIMVSAHSELSAVERARDSGVTDFICKPVSPRLLYERLVGALNRPRKLIETPNFTGPDRRIDAEAIDGPERRQVTYI